MKSKETLQSVKEEYYIENGEHIIEIDADDDRLKAIEDDLEILDWLIDNLYVAPELLELRLVDPHNNSFSDKGIKYHNGIEIKNKDFRKYIDRIHKLKYGR